jgi:hypothetical protein
VSVIHTFFNFREGKPPAGTIPIVENHPTLENKAKTFGYSLTFLPWKACLTNILQHWPFFNCFKLRSLVDFMTDVTSLSRVVTTILLPVDPWLKGSSKRSQHSPLPFQTLSRTSRYFLPVSLCCNWCWSRLKSSPSLPKSEMTSKLL